MPEGDWSQNVPVGTPIIAIARIIMRKNLPCLMPEPPFLNHFMSVLVNITICAALHSKEQEKNALL
jgi:hypothetical protein